MARAFVGTSGWSYPHWGDGVFYPQGLRSGEWLSFYAQHFATVEINSSFYRLPKKAIFESWREKTPSGFCFAVKASRFLTHVKRLNRTEEPLRRLLGSAQDLESKLGPLLFQVPPSLSYEKERLVSFLEALSHQRTEGRFRAALEVRHASWLHSECYELLSAAEVALCFSDWPNVKVEEPVTASFLFVRRHGPQELYASKYPEEQLRREAHRIRYWLDRGKDLYVYFNNDANGWAVEDARALTQALQED